MYRRKESKTPNKSTRTWEESMEGVGHHNVDTEQKAWATR